MEKVEPIAWIKCEKCGYIQHGEHLRCLNCKSTKFEPIEAKGDLRLITYTLLRAPPMEFRDQREYAIGIAEFENGIKLMGQISSNIENISIGMKIKLINKKICDSLNGNEVYTQVFEPIRK